jgi:hypothetical protein
MADDSQLLIKVRLQGAAAARNELAATAGEVKVFGDEAKVAGDKTAFAAEKAFLFGESMYSLKRWTFFGLTAIGATGAGILKMGYDFDEAKSKSIGALTSLVGGAGAARLEVSKLISLTHDSGLGLDVLGTAAKNMLTFGFAVNQTNQYLAAFALFSQKNGLGSAGVDSLSSIFQNVKDTGFFTSRNLKALEGLGVPGNKALGAELGLSPADWYRFTHGQGQIAASTALPAVADYLSKYAKSQPTPLPMQFGIAKSYFSQIFGTLDRPAFNFIDQEMEELTKKGGWLDRITAAGNNGGATGMLKAIDPSGTLVNAWKTLTNAVTVFAGALRASWVVAQPFVAVLAAITGGVLALTSHFGVMNYALGGLLLVYVASRGAMLLWAGAAEVVTVALASLKFGVVLLRAAWLLLDAAIFSNPIGAVVIGVLALAAGFYLLYTRVKAFHDFITTYWPALLTIISGPIVGAITLALTHLSTLWDWLKAVYVWLENHVFKIHVSNPLAGPLGLIEHPLRAVEQGISKIPGVNVGDATKSANKMSLAKLGDDGYKRLAGYIADAVSARPVHVNISGEKVAEATFNKKHVAEART